MLIYKFIFILEYVKMVKKIHRLENIHQVILIISLIHTDKPV